MRGMPHLVEGEGENALPPSPSTPPTSPAHPLRGRFAEWPLVESDVQELEPGHPWQQPDGNPAMKGFDSRSHGKGEAMAQA
jgi:hypothetical protein